MQPSRAWVGLCPTCHCMFRIVCACVQNCTCYVDPTSVGVSHSPNLICTCILYRSFAGLLTPPVSYVCILVTARPDHLHIHTYTNRPAGAPEAVRQYRWPDRGGPHPPHHHLLGGRSDAGGCVCWPFVAWAWAYICMCVYVWAFVGGLVGGVCSEAAEERPSPQHIRTPTLRC